MYGRVLRCVVWTLVACPFFLAPGCDGDDDGGGGLAPAATISGTVTGSGGLEGVEVSAEDVTATTDVAGAYVLEDVPIPTSGRIVITYEKEGYATYQTSVAVSDGQTYAVSAKLSAYTYSEPADNSGETTHATPDDQVTVVLPAGAAGGGAIRVNIAPGDPSTEAGRDAFPGNYMAASAEGGDPDTPLESISFMELTLLDDQGEEITELSSPASVRLRLPAKYQTGGDQAGTYVPGDPEKGTIEWWSYDESNASWTREDADPSTPELDDAVVVDDGGVLYAEAKLTHLTWWNVDHPISEHACLCVQVVGKGDAPVQGAQVVARGVSYDGTSLSAETDANGVGCVNVWRTEDPQNKRTVHVFVKAGDVEFYYDVTDPAEGDVENDWVYTPEAQGSTSDGTTEDCVQLANTIKLVYAGTVQGTVTYESSGQPIPGVKVFSSVGPTAVSDAGGDYAMELPVKKPLVVYIPGYDPSVPQPVEIADGDVPLVVDFVLPNRAPNITSFTADPSSGICAGTAVALSVAATDPDGDPVTYSWSATQGTLSATTGAAVTWTAPADSGTATIEVTASDDAQASTKSQKLLVWDSCTGGGTSLRITVRDDPSSDQPIEGAHVVLHGADSVSMQAAKVTGADGAADFGDISRDRATVTIGITRQVDWDGLPVTERQLVTLVNVKVCQCVYYVDQSGLDYDELGDCDTPSATIGVTAENVAATADYAIIEPSFQTMMSPWTAPSVPICPSAVQTDGKLSLLVSAWQLGAVSEGTMLEYGFLRDATIESGGSYVVTLDRAATQTTWEAPTPIQRVVVGGTLKGVPYFLGSTFLSQAATQGLVPTAAEFTLDKSWAEAEVVLAEYPDPESYRGSLKRYPTLPTNLMLPMPDYNFASISFNSETDVFSWSLSGTSARDAIIINAESFSEGAQYEAFNWEAIMDPAVTSWTVPDLPAELEAWLPSGGAPVDAYIQAVDFDTIDGFDALVALAISGADVEEIANQLLWGFDEVPGVGGAQAKSALSERLLEALRARKSRGSEKGWVPLSKRLGAALGGLLRR